MGGAGFDKAGEPVVWGTERAESGEVTARWWRLGEREARAFPVLGKGTDPLALLAGLDAYATGDEEGGVSLRDLTTGEVRWHVAGPGEPVLRLLVAAEGAVLVAQDAARSLTVIDIEEGHVRGAVRQPGTELVEVAATPAGPWLVGVDRDEEVRVYRLPARGEVGEGNPPDLAAGQAHLLARWAAEDSGAALALAGPDELWTAGRDRRLRRHGLGALSRPGPELLQDAERRYGVRFDGSRLVPRWPDPAP